MIVTVDNLSEFKLVKLLDCLQACVVCLEIDGGPCYLVAPKLKKLKEVKHKPSCPCFKVAAASIELLNGAFAYYGYTMD